MVAVCRRRLALLVAVVFGPSAVACSLLVDTSGLAGDGAGAPLDSSADSPADAFDASVDAPTTGDGATARCADAGTDPSLVLYLPFDEVGGNTAFDCSGRGHDAQLVASATATRIPGHVGGAFGFDGTSTCLSLGAPSDLTLQSDFTIAAWIRVDQFSTPAPANDSRQIIAKTADPSHDGWRFVTDGVGSPLIAFKIGADAGAVSATSTSPQPTGVWLHVASVYTPGNNGSALIYVDGALVGTKSGLPALIDDVTTLAFVGCTKPGSQVLKAALDELRIYSRALTQPEIAALAN